MISLIPTDNMEDVRNILSHDDIWSRYSDGVDFDDFTPTNTSREQWLIVMDNGFILGIIYVHCDTSCSLGFHPYLIKKYRSHGREMVKSFFKWFLDAVPESYLKINVVIPECFKSTVNFSRKVGFTQEGVSRDSYKFNNKVYNRIISGITREEVYDVLEK